MKILKTHSMLGEGLSYLKHAKRIIGFDILLRKIYLINPNTNWSFKVIDIPFRGSCAMELNNADVLIAGDHALYQTRDFNTFEVLIQHDFADDIRMNDGREDHLGRFWYSTMAMNADRPSGAVYCYDPRTKSSQVMIEGLTIPNAICFDQSLNRGYVADSSKRVIYYFDISSAPLELKPFLDLSSKPYVPDGAVVDSNGSVWNAQWGGSQVAQYNHNGAFINAIDLPATQVTCPLLYDDHLIVTSARIGLSQDELKHQPQAGNIFITKLQV
jgi:sugar lactone lactonase YvrE